MNKGFYLILYETWEITCEWRSHSFVSFKYFYNLICSLVNWANRFSKSSRWSNSAFFCVYLQGSLCLLFMFWAVIFVFWTSFVAVPTAWILINFVSAPLQVSINCPSSLPACNLKIYFTLNGLRRSAPSESVCVGQYSDHPRSQEMEVCFQIVCCPVMLCLLVVSMQPVSLIASLF